jgi:hypothetical protein
MRFLLFFLIDLGISKNMKLTAHDYGGINLSR